MDHAGNARQSADERDVIREVRVARPDDLKALAPQAAEMWLRDHADADLSLLPVHGPEWTACLDGKPIGTGGFIEFAPGAVLTWATLIPMSRSDAIWITRVCREHLRQAPYTWIESRVIDGFDLSVRWTQIVGLEPIEGDWTGPDGKMFHRFVYKGPRAYGH